MLVFVDFAGEGGQQEESQEKQAVKMLAKTNA